MKSISIFVSSTFNDMQSERDLIKEKIAPEIEKYINKFGYSIEFIDLRWGINTQSIDENEANKKILRTCFSEIKKTKPFFIALVGERYGWIPDKEDVLAAFQSEGIQVDSSDTEKSITELEIACATKLYAQKDRCFFYFRDKIDYGDDLTAKNTFVSDSTQQKKISKLKNSINDKYDGQIRVYSANWDKSKQRIVGLNKFEEQLYNDLIAAINDELKNVVKPNNSIEESINITDSAIVTMSGMFSGRQSVLNSIKSFLHSNSQLMCLVGESGCGKSSVLAKISDLNINDGKCVIPFFAGIDDFSTTVENMLKSSIVRLSNYLQTELCFDPKTEEFDYKELLSQFFNLLNKASLSSQVIVVVDALNQLLRSPLEEKLKWLNLFALNPNVKIIVSSTNDYYQLNIIKSLNADLLNLEFFSVSDIEEVTKHYFSMNHKEIDTQVLSAIMNKKSNELSLCSLPVYLLTVLQQLNNIDGDDFSAIHNRERELGESASDAIINYLTEIVTTAPDEIGALLDVSLNRVAKKVGDLAYLFTNVIALSRRGITEKYIAKICSHLNIAFDSISFSYYRKLMKNNLCERENGSWDFNHSLIKNYFKNSVKTVSKDKIINSMISILEIEDNTSQFKKTDFVYWLNLGNRLDLFVPYFYEQKNNPQVCEAFLSELQINPTSGTITKLFFPASIYTDVIWDFFSLNIKNGLFSHDDSNYLGCKILNSIYSYNFNSDADRVNAILNTYIALSISSRRAGYYHLAIDYLKIAIKLNKKISNASIDVLIYSELAECYFALGKGITSLKYRKLAIAACSNSENAQEELLNENYLACVQRTKELVLNYKPIKAYIQSMASIVEQNKLDNERAVFWSIRILQQAEIVNMPITELSYEVALCDSYINESGSNAFMSAKAAYSLALICFNSSPDISNQYLQKARNFILLELKVNNEVERLSLYYKIINFEIFISKCKSKKITELNEEKLKCLQQLLVIAPTFNVTDDYLYAAKTSCKGSDSSSSYDKEAYNSAKRLRRKLSQGQISAEQKVINKILLAIAVTVSSVFLVIMPVFFSIFRGYVGMIFKNSSIYSVFMTYYIPAAIESLFNMFAGFTLYGIIRLIRVGHDYLAKILWIKRTCIFFAITILMLIIHALDWNYLKSYSSLNNYEYFSVGLPYVFLLFMEVVPLILIANTIMDYISIGRWSRSRRINYNSFQISYNKTLLNIFEEFGFYCIAYGLFHLFNTINNNNHYRGMVLYSTTIYNYIMIALATLLIVKTIYYTLMFVLLRKENVKTFKN